MYFAKKRRLLGAITLVVAAMVLPQSGQPVTRAAALDLGSEIRVLDSYVDDLAAFDNKCALLEKKGSLIRTELDPIQARATATGSALSPLLKADKPKVEFLNIVARVTIKGSATVQTRQTTELAGSF